MQTAFIGIDPGGSGAACLLTDSRGVKFHDWSNVYAAREAISIWTSDHSDIRIGLEEPAHLPHRSGFYGVKGLWRNVGQWEGILSGLGLDWSFVPTKVWRRVVPKRGKKNVKVSSLEFARSILPDGQRHIYLKKHHNRAEALCIAVYLREFEKLRRRRIQ